MSEGVVKQEVHDDPEIVKLSEEIAQNNKAKLMATQIVPNLAVASMTLNRLPRNNEITITALQTPQIAMATNNAEEANTTAMDSSSQRGQFGWSTVESEHIPYLLRNDDVKYVSSRMVERRILHKYLHKINGDIYNFITIQSYYITEPEARLLNEINFVHCDSIFGREEFNGMEVIVALDDVYEFCRFLECCFSRLVKGYTLKKHPDRCGFVQIDKESVVPYAIRDGVSYVPLFYFEGEVDELKRHAIKMMGWDLAYLKFCCKVQGIKNELYHHHSCTVVSLEHIKNYFPQGTVFEAYWPKEMAGLPLLSTKPINYSRQWLQLPTTQPYFKSLKVLQNILPSGTVVPQAVTSARNPTYTPQCNIVMQTPRTLGPTMPAARVGRPRSYATNLATARYQPPPSHVLNFANTQQLNYQLAHSSNGSGAVNTQPQQQQGGGYNRISYKIAKAVVDGKTILCINQKPYTFTDLVMTVSDLVENFFSSLSEQTCRQMLQVLGISTEKATFAQRRILHEYGKCSGSQQQMVSLVRVSDINHYMPQLKYMMREQAGLRPLGN